MECSYWRSENSNLGARNSSTHSWQAIAAGGTTIGLKGTKLAAEVLADTAIALFKDQKIIQRAKKELLEKQGPEFD